MAGLLFVIGTRPEAIKMAPLILAARAKWGTEVKLCVTAQHREMLDGVLKLFEIRPDYDLNIMQPGQSLADVTRAVLKGMDDLLKEVRPRWMLVHGDTTTTLASSLAAYYNRIPLAHVEAGLRTGNKFAPFPEEINRKVAGAIADLHFAPTDGARSNLLREGVPSEQIFVTGNTVVDALLWTVEKLQEDLSLRKELDARFKFLAPKKRLIFVTAHRRENFGAGFERICQALLEIAERHPEIEMVYPVHPNPQVQEPVRRLLGKRSGQIHLVEPLDYLPLVYLLDRCAFVITDSGGLQEEAPSLGKPVLVMRELTERPEAITAGTVRLVGTDTRTIVAAAAKLLGNGELYSRMSHAHSPYGDGHASERILGVLSERLGQDVKPGDATDRKLS